MKKLKETPLNKCTFDLFNKTDHTLKTNQWTNLLDKMHSTFTISDESDRKFRVWSVVELEAEDYPVAEAIEMMQSSMEDYLLFRDTYPLPEDDE